MCLMREHDLLTGHLRKLAQPRASYTKHVFLCFRIAKDVFNMFNTFQAPLWLLEKALPSEHQPNWRSCSWRALPCGSVCQHSALFMRQTCVHTFPGLVRMVECDSAFDLLKKFAAQPALLSIPFQNTHEGNEPSLLLQLYSIFDI